ncbi:hypothetical protein DVH24_040203, partial [Malus domestica]
LSSPSPLPQLSPPHSLGSLYLNPSESFSYQQSSPSSLSRRYELNHSLGILKVEPRSPVHELRRAPAPFKAISGQTTASWPACKFPARPTAFEEFYGQTTAS